MTTPRWAVRRDLIAAALAALLVAAAFLVPHLASADWRKSLYAATAPIFGSWLPHVGWGTVPAIVIAAVVALAGPRIAARLRWRGLLAVTWATSVAWTMALAMVDGWQRGFADRLTTRDEYLHEVPGVTDIPAMVRGFSGRILDFQPHSWTTHVSGHPPGALLVFVWLDRIGLHGGAWAGGLCVLVGTSATVAVLIALRRLSSERVARAAAPFLALAPAAIWIAVSADAFFAGVAAWAVALLSLAATMRARRGLVVGFSSGVLFGFSIYLNYGLVLLGVFALAVLIGARSWRPLVPAVIGAFAVAAAFTAAGFWWFDGYHLVVQRYYQGIASQRPFDYWGWANLAAVVCATGLAVPAALPRVLTWRALRAWEGLTLLVGSAVCCILAADLSALSKAETERIWLPFTIWLMAAPALLPLRHRRAWLAIQGLGALVLVHLILTNW
ncbi:hypothetical protein FOS14_01695 [Skermania sp. ID1734]|uniref:hypothetical protein n=1 Tax=Skermania sp. ID1734 TaxID=2597516 RepID=UPI00117C49DF|nr:hypothetical protein [Skermania sp. ID1734]TSE02120.1 hypothetical protein FOS14_01695 [Skermania sp. ID1734]